MGWLSLACALLPLAAALRERHEAVEEAAFGLLGLGFKGLRV